MNTKLTLSVDDKVIEKAKQYAYAHNTSVSQIVENYLREVVHNKYVTDSELGQITSELISGKPFKSDKTVKELLGDALAEKYL